MYINWNQFEMWNLSVETGTGTCACTSEVRSTNADDGCPQQRSRWLRAPSHTWMAARIKDTCKRQGHAGAKRSAWGPKQKWRGRAKGSEHAQSNCCIESCYIANVVGNIATATMRSGGRVLVEQTAQLTQACRCEAFKYQGCRYYANKMLVQVLEGKSFLDPEFRPLCSSLAGAHDGFFHFFTLPHKLFAAYLVISNTYTGLELNTEVYPPMA